eukprot:gnl/Hemi2/2454_TR870_c0_g1_i1.p1 gnl/Hemi2/2454_TR870_c0_g1~~gnl/Hemi2/2454_TR870_c0_g1_i1.p1  ORF type:complete len:519 (+),score=165.36 gnl/Hemi2/2454_TR870_c0_g1_i1:115-1671(+)
MSDSSFLASPKKDYEAVDEPEVEIPDDGSTSITFSWRKLWAFTGPGFLMSIAYLDPGNLESDLQAGAVAGYSLIWVLWWATVMGLFLQILAARLGVVKGRHLAQLCREEFPGPPRYTLWIMTEIAIIASDIQEVVGSAIALQILFGLPLWAGVLITALDTFSFLGLHAYGIRKLEAFFGILIGTMCICFFAEFIIGKPSMLEIGEGLVIPRVSGNSIMQAVGMVGAVIMPHNIYLHSALVQSRKIDTTSRAKVSEANYYYAIECAVALFVSFLINLAVLAVFAGQFYNNPAYNTSDIGLSNAGEALAKSMGSAAKIIWAVGLLAAGQSSTMTGTYAGQFVMEGFLELHMPPWKRVMITRSIAIVPAVLVAIIAQQDLDALDEWLNVLQSVQLPFALLPLLRFVSSKTIMGEEFVLHSAYQALAWVLGLMVMAFNIYLVWNFQQTSLPDTWVVYLIMGLIGVVYFAFLGYISLHPLHHTSNRVVAITTSGEAPLSAFAVSSQLDSQQADTVPLVTHDRV